MKHLKNFLNDESGATAIEYGLIAAIVAIGIIVGLGFLQGGLNSIFTQTGNELETAAGRVAGSTTPQ